MKVKVLESLTLPSGEIPAGKVIDVPPSVAEKLRDKLEPLEAIEAKSPPAVESMTGEQFEQAGQIITWRTGSGRTVFICPARLIDRYRQHGQAWFTPWEIVELRAMQLDADTIEKIIDGKEIMGLEICGTC